MYSQFGGRERRSGATRGWSARTADKMIVEYNNQFYELYLHASSNWYLCGTRTQPSIKLVLERPQALTRRSLQRPGGIDRPASLQQPFIFSFRTPARPRPEVVNHPALGSG